MTTRIVTYAHRYKRPPRKKQTATLEVPAIVRRGRKGEDEAAAHPAPVSADRKPAVVTARKPGSWRSDVPELTPEEIQRRRDAADALFREMVRQATDRHE
jgi:hypothetical protein